MPTSDSYATSSLPNTVRPECNSSADGAELNADARLRRSVGALILLLAGLCFWQGSDVFLGEGITEQAVAATSREIVPVAAVQPTGESTSGVPLGTQFIEDIDVGQWVLSGNPTGEDDLQFGIEVDPETWRLLELRAPKTDGSYADVRMLRPLWWLELQTLPTFVVRGPEEESGIVLVSVVDDRSEPGEIEPFDPATLVGETIHVSVPECGINGDAHVLSIGGCPQISPRPGPEFQVVTATFEHHAARVLDLSIDGVGTPIGSTPNHPFWSEDRQEFVRADELVVGERLRQSDGSFTRLAAVSTIGTLRIIL